MSRDEDTEDQIAAGNYAAPGEPVDMTKRELSSAVPTLPSLFSVVIAADGSAAIDGMPVSAAECETLDAAILDTLHGYASRQKTPVTAAISDPAVANVTYVVVAPDGSSRLVDQPPTAGQAPVPGRELGHVGPDQDLDDDRLDEDDDLYSLSQSDVPSRPTAVPCALQRRPESAGLGAQRQSDDEYRAAGLLHRPLVVGPVALGVAALVIVSLVLLGSGGGQQNKAADAGNELSGALTSREPSSQPTVSLSPSLLWPSARTSPKPKATGHTSYAGGRVGGMPTVTVKPPETTTIITAKPAVDTAATAVNWLAKNDPGRHICYRAYVSGRGWQKPVCDGTVAGTTGQNLSIKALNIAVRGTGGVAANAFVHNPHSTDGRGIWKPHWTSADDGKDIYIGKAQSSAPNMLGFAINIGKGGQLCEIAHVHNSGWGQTGCVNQRPEYIFGGTLGNDAWLEAVKFRV
ncbi:hypothetical protein [Streptomyces sp. NBC_01462]|uniref:hypothetical protein n=1 Tax=Streptomyces sp. NBC_01462 TaxID=2903876 RepID=UPI002E365686|nr:hypothetical protein [Streptomyces sp. NBC_01462]